ncbi:hypothetical protein [Polyangium jinanense]|uniref:Uncharacterized protein n=1 Tax=Polyangium jinanense TaxID=2829994 RepID=A0A9X3X587_9BACT|nr:hypothetical protein [Polyangium jinanense]MDC3960690.1 hypothetical protein [Polyangium jinanense]MDC3984522.1 hypothetical protein [Polyangium jinanense]
MFKVSVQKVSSAGDEETSTVGGFDHNFPRVPHFEDVMSRFLMAVRVRWPNAIFRIYDENDNEVVLRAPHMPATWPPKGWAIVVRDDLMDKHLEEEGGVPMPDGESGLVLWFSPVSEGISYLDLVTVSDPLENQFCWWAVEQIWDAYLSVKKAAKDAT